MTQIAFQGEHGAYSEEALYQHFGETATAVPCRTFEDVFEGVVARKMDFGVVPVENSLAGSINKTYDLLLDHDLRVHGEILLRVRHCLLAPADQDTPITKVRSHPQALAQCAQYLRERGYEPVAWYDTAGSAQSLTTQPEPGTAAIAGRLAGQRYGLHLVEEHIEDQRHNFTRFFVIGHGEAPRAEVAKTSLMFAVPEVPGALYDALAQFASRQINLTKIESRPRRDRLWQYIFYLDFDGHWQDPEAGAALVGLLSKAAFVKLLGSYPAAQAMPAI